MTFSEAVERLKWKLIFRKSVVYYEWGDNIKIGERAQVISLGSRKGRDKFKKIRTGTIVDRDFDTGRFETKNSVYIRKSEEYLRKLMAKQLPILTEEIMQVSPPQVPISSVDITL